MEGISVVSREVAYAGRLGNLRQGFSQAYMSHKRRVLAETEVQLARTAAHGGASISCHDGCDACCFLFIEASLQECEALAYYLYHHEDILNGFLRRYPEWHRRTGEPEPGMAGIDRLNDQLTGSSGIARDRLMEQKRNYRRVYLEKRNACPFLNGHNCSVHEMRPYVCASLAAVTPPAWCEPSHSKYPAVEYYQSDLYCVNEVPFFLSTRHRLPVVSMPGMTFNILTRGYRAWSAVPGLEYTGAVENPDFLAELSQVRAVS